MKVGERKTLGSTEKYGKVTAVCLGCWDSPDADIKKTFTCQKGFRGSSIGELTSYWVM